MYPPSQGQPPRAATPYQKPDPITPIQQPNCPEPDIDAIADAVMARIQIPAPPAGKDGRDGRGIDSVTLEGDKIRVTYSDGDSQDIGPLGHRVEMYDLDGKQVDSEWVPINGVLRLRKYQRKAG